MTEPTEFEKLMQSYQKAEEPSDFDKLMQSYQYKNTASPVIDLPKNITGMSETDLAKLYADTRSSGFNDAQIRAAADQKYGKQTDANWDYLTSLAGFAPNADGAGVVGKANTGVVAGAPPPTTDAVKALDTYSKQFAGKDYTLDRAVVDKLTQQILAQNTTSKWSGEGFGSSLANANAMAENLFASGITDISQVGLVDKKVDEALTPIYEQGDWVQSGGEGDGYFTQKIVGYKDSKGNIVDPNLVRSETVYSGGDAGSESTSYLAPIGIQKLIGNKTTGQGLLGDYDEAGKENIWSGTYAGKGNTAYRVKFDDKGNPYFYTTGHSSNDLVKMLADDPILNTVAQIGASYFFGPWGNVALNAAMGKDAGDIAKSYVLSQLGQEAFKGLTTTGAEQNLFGETGANFAKDIKDVFGKTGSEFLGKTANQYIANEGKIDLGSVLVNQGVGVATNAVLSEIPGFDGLNATEKKFVTNIVSSTLNDGKLSPNEAVNAAVNYGTQALKNLNKNTKVADAGTDDAFKLPGGIQLAAADTGTMSDAGNRFNVGAITSAPIFAESKGADQIEVPFGSRLMSAKEEVETIDPNTGRTTFSKPEGAYYDAVSNAWFVREDLDKVLNSGTVGADLDLFRQSQGDLDKIAAQTKSTSDDYMADFLESIGIKSVDDLASKKLSNADIMDMINAGDGVPNLLVSDKRLKDDNIDTLEVKGKRIEDTIGTLDTDKKEDEVDELVVTGTKDDKIDLNTLVCGEGMELSADGKSCVPIKTVTTPIKCGEGFKLSEDGKSCVPIVKTTGPIKCGEGFELSADGKSCVPIKKKTAAEPFASQSVAAPSQDPYANIKLMEELFGGDIAYKLRDFGAPKNLASADLDAIARLLRG